MLHSGRPVCPRNKRSLSLGQTGVEGRQQKFMACSLEGKDDDGALNHGRPKMVSKHLARRERDHLVGLPC